MNPTRISRRAVLGGVLMASLVGGGLVALADAPAGCAPTYTDPAGDSGLVDPATNPVVGDDDLDIVAVTHSVDAGMFTSAVKVVKLLATGPDYSFGDRFITSFTVAKKAVTVTAERDFSGLGSVKGSVTVGGAAVAVPVKVVQDIKGSTISAVVAAAELEKAVGAPLTGEPFTAMSAAARSIYPSNAASSVGVLFDTATAPATATYAFGASCGGGAAAAPASPAPSPSASPAPSSSPQPSATPTAGIGASGLPAPDCFLAKDPKGDGKVGNSNVPNDPDLDVTGIVLQTTPDAVVAYWKVDKLAAGPASTDGHRFTFYFTHNKNVFALAGSAYKNAVHGQIRNGAASTGQFSKVTQLSVNGPPLTDPMGRVNTGFVESGLKFTFDLKNSYVIATLPIKDIEKYGKAPVAGATFTGVYATSAADTDLLASGADTAPDGATASNPGKLTYSVGDNSCFAPATPPLSSVGATKAQHGDTAAVAAKLVDGAGAPVAGKKVTFALGSTKATGTTGKDGVAKAALLVKEKAGSRVLTLTSGDVTATQAFTVLVEKTVLKATGGSGAVTATLADDDRKGVAGQTVTFTSGAKKVTARTGGNGVARATGFATGSTVTVTYAGAPGLYSASKTTAKA